MRSSQTGVPITEGYLKVFSIRQIVLVSFLFCFAGSFVLAGQGTNLACGPPKEKVKVVLQKGEHPVPELPAGKALIYVLRVKKFRQARIQANKMLLGIEGQWVGGTLPGTYFHLPVEPGLITVCSAVPSGPPNLLAITAEAGKVYYFEQWAGSMLSRNYGLKQLTVEEAKPLLESAEYATLVKGK
jgi:hypothetical protein